MTLTTNDHLHVALDGSDDPNAVVELTPGGGPITRKHAGRYARLAESLTGAGYGVYASDHRGHGRTCTEKNQLGFFAEGDGWKICVDDLWLVNRRIASGHCFYPGPAIHRRARRCASVYEEAIQEGYLSGFLLLCSCSSSCSHPLFVLFAVKRPLRLRGCGIFDTTEQFFLRITTIFAKQLYNAFLYQLH